MSNDLKYIDNIVKDSLSKFEVKSNNNSWDKIERQMPSNNLSQIRRFLSSKSFIAVSVLMLILGSVYFLYYNDAYRNNSEDVLIADNIETNILINSSSQKKTTNKYEDRLIDSQTVDYYSSNSETIRVNNKYKIKGTKQNIDGIYSTNTLDKIYDVDATTEASSDWFMNSEIIKDTNHNNVINNLTDNFASRNVREPVSFANSSTKGCVPLIVAFEANTLHASEYNWNFGYNNATSQQENPNYTYSIPGTYIVELKANNLNGDEITVRYDTIIAYDTPKADFRISTIYVMLNNQLHTEPMVCFNLSERASQYNWNFGDGTISDQARPIHYYSKQGTYNISLTVRNETNCSDSVSFKNSIIAKYIYIPTGFNPNKNGQSDGYYSINEQNSKVFYPIIKDEIMQYNFQIFSRNGARVFATNNIKLGWDGYYNEKLCSEGVYVWKLYVKFKNGDVFFKNGDVTVVY